jgi:hypothetical protein
LLKCTTKEFVHLVQGQEYKAIAQKQVTVWEWKREKTYTQYKVNGYWYCDHHFEIIG